MHLETKGCGVDVRNMNIITKTYNVRRKRKQVTPSSIKYQSSLKY